MKLRILLLAFMIVVLFIAGCTQPDTPDSSDQTYSEKTVHLQDSIQDYSATVEEELQNNGPVITREIVIKRPDKYRIHESGGCYDISNGTVLWSYCNGAAAATYFADPAVKKFCDDVDYQQIFANMLTVSPGTMNGTALIDGKDTWVIEVTPAGTPYHLRYTFESVRLWVDRKSGIILRAEMIPKNKTNMGVIRFTNVTVNSGISDELFVFEPGPGIKIIDQKAGRFVENLEGKAGYSQVATPCTGCPLPRPTPSSGVLPIN